MDVHIRLHYSTTCVISDDRVLGRTMYAQLSVASQSGTPDEAESWTEVRSVETQVDDWRMYSNPELHNEIALRLSNDNFCLRANDRILLMNNYDSRRAYTQAGAVYSSIEKRWPFPPGLDVRRVLTTNPEWFDEPDMVRRRILIPGMPGRGRAF